MTIDEVIKNIDTVVSNSRMTRQEHALLQENIVFLDARARIADKLEEEKRGGTK